MSAVLAGDLIDAQTPVRGCAILKPRGYALWDGIRRDLDARIGQLGVQNVSFPLLCPPPFCSARLRTLRGLRQSAPL